MELSQVVAALERAGCVAAHEEATELVRAAADQGVDIGALVDRRATGEPLAWITGWTTFCGSRVRVEPGIYVPRWDTEVMAAVAIAELPDDGVAVDFCTGSGAIAVVLAARRPRATVIATDIDPAAVACARANGVDARLGDLDAPLPAKLRGTVDVITAVVPYVPTESLHLLPRDTRAFEPRRALDGGPGGTDVLARAIDCSTRWMRPGGAIFFELGGGQSARVAPLLRDAGFDDVAVLTDHDGDERAVTARYRPPTGGGGRPGAPRGPA